MTVTAMLSDVKGFRDVLQSMEDTFEELDSQPSTGHIGAHWNNLSRSLQDGCGSLEKLDRCSWMLIRMCHSSTQLADMYG
jgi:hypothetical protein